MQTVQHTADAKPRTRLPSFVRQAGPGIVTGAADDDPSGIATYTQAGAQFGTGILWTVFLTLPFMIAVQLVSARIGRQSGKGIVANLKTKTRPAFVYTIVALLLLANTINIAADIAAMGAAVQLVVGGSPQLHALLFGVATVLLQVLVPYRRLAPVLRWLTLSLFVYVGASFAVDIPWRQVLRDLVVPTFVPSSAFWMTLVAILGTTISPYLFFWQASQEVEELQQQGIRPRREKVRHIYQAIRRLRIDTVVGMVFSNAIAFFVMLMGAVVLHAAGHHEVASAAEAAEALRPLAGDLAFSLFAVGIVTTGMLAVPVLASSAAYAVAEVFGWPEGLERHWREARGFYGIVVLATLAGTLLGFTPINPMKALVWAAVVNGVVAVPILAVMMMLAADPKVMGPLVVRRRTRALGWGAVGLMGAAVVMMGHDLLQ